MLASRRCINEPEPPPFDELGPDPAPGPATKAMARSRPRSSTDDRNSTANQAHTSWSTAAVPANAGTAKNARVKTAAPVWRPISSSPAARAMPPRAGGATEATSAKRLPDREQMKGGLRMTAHERSSGGSSRLTEATGGEAAKLASQ